SVLSFYLFFFTDTATSEIYTLSLHDALPIWDHWLFLDKGARKDLVVKGNWQANSGPALVDAALRGIGLAQLPDYYVGEYLASGQDRKSTRLNSSHVKISYAVFCLKKKKNAQR